jgi:hypothetical protein
VSRTRLGVALGLTLLAAACSRGASSTAAPPTAPSTAPRLLTLGGSATEGDGIQDRLHRAWPYLVFHEALPESATLVNAATDDGRALTALSEQVPLAGETKPDIAAVWIGADDVRARTPLSEFRFAFTRIVDDLRADGARRVVVGTVPKAYGEVAAYNDIIRTVARTQHAQLVELEHAPVALTPAEGLEPQPDTAGHRVVADAYERAVR